MQARLLSLWQELARSIDALAGFSNRTAYGHATAAGRGEKLGKLLMRRLNPAPEPESAAWWLGVTAAAVGLLAVGLAIARRG